MISSTQNPLVKKFLLLHEKSRERKKTGLFLIEGRREIQIALRQGYVADTLLFCPEILPHPYSDIPLRAPTPKTLPITKQVYQKLTYRNSTEGLIALVKSKSHTLDTLKFKTDNPLILVAEAPEKPGNIGALLRTADAAALDAVLIANPKTDLYNPNIIRSSLGGVFTTQIAMGSSAEIITFLKQRHIKIYCAALTASKPYTEVGFTQPTALVVGAEATGLTSEWLTNTDENLIIPMQGQVDSLNVSISAAILIFEAKRQRRF